MVDTGCVLRTPEGVALLPDVGPTLLEARRLGFHLIVVSNQPGVARGLITTDELRAVQQRLEELLLREGVKLDGVRFCTHALGDGCLCRKPAPGMLRQAAKSRGIDLERSVMLGDRESDVLAGRAAGCSTTVLLDQGRHKGCEEVAPSAPSASSPPPTSATYSIGALADLVPILRRLS